MEADEYKNNYDINLERPVTVYSMDEMRKYKRQYFVRFAIAVFKCAFMFIASYGSQNTSIHIIFYWHLGQLIFRCFELYEPPGRRLYKQGRILNSSFFLLWSQVAVGYFHQIPMEDERKEF